MAGLDPDPLVPAWHAFHSGLLGFVRIAARRAQIDATKPENERATRHHMLRVVSGELPEAVRQAGETYQRAGETYRQADEAYCQSGEAYRRAGEAYRRAWEDYKQAWEASQRAGETYGQAWAFYEEACKAHRPAIEALHAAECGCGQGWDMPMRFP